MTQGKVDSQTDTCISMSIAAVVTIDKGCKQYKYLSLINYQNYGTIMHYLTMGIHSEKCSAGQFCHCANSAESTYTNLGGTDAGWHLGRTEEASTSRWGLGSC